MNPKNTHVDTAQTTTHIGLCAGYGGIELGLKRVIPDLRTVALCEIEAFACANLVAKMEAGLMDASPIWSDLKTFPWAEFRGKVDILTGGYPCQPFSAAGKRAGKDDPRHLWPWIADGIRLLRPRMCFFENVEGHITLGLSTVISDLEEMGYRTTWGIFSASEVGAPHQRKRVFILAHNQRERIEKLSRWIADESQQHPAWNDCGDVWPSRPGEPQHEWEPPRVVADANSQQSQRGRNAGELESTSGAQQSEIQQRQRSRHAFGDQGSAGAIVGDADSTRSQERSWQRGTELQGTDADGREDAEWQAESSLGRDADGLANRMDDAKLYVTSDNRTDELRLLGNGVVPATAERAFRVLMAKL